MPVKGVVLQNVAGLGVDTLIHVLVQELQLYLVRIQVPSDSRSGIMTMRPGMCFLFHFIFFKKAINRLLYSHPYERIPCHSDCCWHTTNSEASKVASKDG
jgi:hypothetical protein